MSSFLLIHEFGSRQWPKNLPSFIQNPGHFLVTGRRVCPANGTHKIVANKPFEILLTNFSVVEKRSPEEMFFSYATGIPVIHLIFTSDLATVLWVPLNLMVDEATAATIWQRRTASLTWTLLLHMKRFIILRLLVRNRIYGCPSRRNKARL